MAGSGVAWAVFRRSRPRTARGVRHWNGKGDRAMGFQKGSITLSPTRDIPLLLQVLYSRLITHDQLREFMLLDGYEDKHACFNWRVRRLVQGGLLNRECARPITASPVYSLTPVAALMLAEHC